MKYYIEILCVIILLFVIMVLNNRSNHINVEYVPSETTNVAEETTGKETNVETTVADTTTEPVVETITEPTEEPTVETTVEPTESIPIESEDNHIAEFLLDIEKPDYTYEPVPIFLSDYDREQLAHLVMGEFSTGGFTGCALIAQSVRDAMVKFGYTSVKQVIKEMKYSGWYSGEPKQYAYDAVDYIFDQGNAAVQHRILVMYAPNIVSSPWHEKQEFVVQYKNVRFFDY